MKNASKVIKSENYQWEGVSRRDYKDDTSTYKGVHRYTLLGKREDEQALNFQTRYFEVKAGGYTSFEYHRHPHSVIVIRGSGTVILDNSLTDIGLHDVIFVAPDTLHQFHADKGEPLGFLCVADRYRDRPNLPGSDKMDSIISSDDVRNKIKR